MLIRQEDSDYFVKVDTLKDPDPFPDTKMSFVIANPPFGQAWGGKDADDGVEDAVKKDHQLFDKTEGRQGSFLLLLQELEMLNYSSIFMLLQN